MSKQQSILVLIRQAPLLSSLPAAALDVLLTAAAFEQKTSLVFSGKGVLHLLKNQQKKLTGVRSISQALSVLDLYEVKLVYAVKESLDEYALQEEDLLIPVQLLSRSELALMLEEQERVFNF